MVGKVYLNYESQLKKIDLKEGAWGGMNFNVNFADIIKAPLKVFIGLFIATGIVLFLPDSLATKMYMVDFRNKYGFVISLVFICSFTISVVGGISAYWSKSKEKRRTKRALKNAKEGLKKLDDYKAAIVYELYKEDNHTSELPLNDGAVRWLEQLVIIGKATNNYPVWDLTNPVFPYMLQPWVVSELDSNEELRNKFKDANEKTALEYSSSSIY